MVALYNSIQAGICNRKGDVAGMGPVQRPVVCLQDAGRDIKAAQSMVTAKRRAFPRNAPDTHAAALEALERTRQNNVAPEASQPQVSFRSVMVIPLTSPIE